MRTDYREIEARSILVRSGLPDTDYVANPYTGCEFACGYCYASFMGRFAKRSIGDWGRYVYIKANAVSLLESELRRMKPARRQASILLSSVTDPYQGVEARYRLTRGILETLATAKYPGLISILTKSPLVLRDIDLLGALPRAEVGLTVTTTSDRISRWLEVRAPLARRRLDTLRRLHAAGIETYAFVGPLLPHFRYQPKRLEELIEGLAAAGVGSVYVEHLNLSGYILLRLRTFLQHEPTEVRFAYEQAGMRESRLELDAMTKELLTRYGLRLRLGGVLDHVQNAGT